MNPLNGLTPTALRKAADIKDRILKLQDELNQLLGASPPAHAAPAAPKKRKMSAAGRAAIAAGARMRWAKLKAAIPIPNAAEQPTNKMSAAGRARLSTSAKARWKKAKVAGKATL